MSGEDVKEREKWHLISKYHATISSLMLSLVLIPSPWYSLISVHSSFTPHKLKQFHYYMPPALPLQKTKVTPRYSRSFQH